MLYFVEELIEFLEFESVTRLQVFFFTIHICVKDASLG